MLRLKSQKSISGMPTKANSVNEEIQKWSYFEKMERLKSKILQTHNKIKLEGVDSGKQDLTEALKTTDVYRLMSENI